MTHGEGCTCGCGGQLLLADDRTTDEERQRLSMAFEQMMKVLHKQDGSHLRVDLVADKKVQEFIDTHAGILNSTLPTQDLTPRMRERLERSNYIFSGMKAFHEMHEAFPSLLDEHGQRKPFNQFLQEVQSIDSTYNKNYLRAEYNFVQQSAEMARKWELFAQDGDRYYLQYRTANDDRVRPEHEEMDRITLPMDDPFWEEFYPPNGWNCRCNVVQVRKSKYAPTPPTEAIERAAGATGRDVRGVFKFNAGREESTVPAHNPYTISRCNTCPIAHNKRKGRMELAKFVPSNEACAACKFLQECYAKKGKSENAIKRKHYEKIEMPRLLDKKVIKQVRDTKLKIKFNKRGNDHLINDVLMHLSGVFNIEDLPHIDQILENATYAGEGVCTDPKKPTIKYFYYFKGEIDGRVFYLNVAEEVFKKKSGQYSQNHFLYAITKSILRKDKVEEYQRRKQKEYERKKRK